MSVLFGLIAAVLFAIVAALITTALGFRDGDRPGDARVTARAVVDSTSAPFAEIVVNNGHDSPVLVSARSRRASVFALAAPHAQRTALLHRRGLGGAELLGAVEGQGSARYLLPLDRAHAATKVTVVIDQAARRTRITTATLRAPTANPIRSALPRDAADA